MIERQKHSACKGSLHSLWLRQSTSIPMQYAQRLSWRHYKNGQSCRSFSRKSDTRMHLEEADLQCTPHECYRLENFTQMPVKMIQDSENTNPFSQLFYLLLKSFYKGVKTAVGWRNTKFLCSENLFGYIYGENNCKHLHWEL